MAILTPRIVSGKKYSAKSTTLKARERAHDAALCKAGLIQVDMTLKQLSFNFGVSVPFILEAIAKLQAEGKDDVQLSLPIVIDELWAAMDQDEREMVAHRHSDSIFNAA